MNIQQRLVDRKQPPSVEPATPSATPVKRQRSFLRRHALALGAVGALLLAGLGYEAFFANGSNAPQALVMTAARGDVEDLVTALGSLQPLTSVDVGAQVSGQLIKLNVQVGDMVEEGQMLAEIDAKIASAKVDADQAQLQNFQAQLAEKQSNLALAKIQADRQQRLLADNATSQDAYDSAQAAFRSAEAQVKSVTAQINQTQSTLKADQANLSYTKIVAPVSGTVSNIVAKQGQTLNANQTTPTIMTLADLKTMTVYTQVSEADVPKLETGMQAFFTTLGNPNKRYTGKLRQILPTPTVVNNVVLYTALFDVTNDGQLMPQMSAQVFFVRASAHDVVTVPVAALQFGRAQGGAGQRGGGRGQGRGGQQSDQLASGEDEAKGRPATVTVVNEDGSTETRDVVVGVSDRVTAAILSGLSEGEQVVAGSGVAAAGARPARGAQNGQNGRGFVGGLR
jgi:macrolide-specific efflux system membrane fusion protein